MHSLPSGRVVVCSRRTSFSYNSPAASIFFICRTTLAANILNVCAISSTDIQTVPSSDRISDI